MKRPPLQVPTAVRVGSGIAPDGTRPGPLASAAMECRLGVLAFGDSITNGGGELQWGVALQSWALWLARGLGLPFTTYAVDGARAADVAGAPARRLRRAHRRGRTRATTSAASTPASTTCARRTGSRRRSSATCARRSPSSAARCDRVLVCTLPLDLGRPRVGRARARGERARSARAAADARRARRRAGGLRRAQPRDGRRASTRPRSARSSSPSARWTCSPPTAWPCASARAS